MPPTPPHHSHSSEPNAGASYSPSRREAGKLDSSSSRMQTARRAKHAEDNGTPSERRVAAEDAGLRPLREVTRKTGPPLNDQMDTEDTSDDGVGARDARDDEGNAEWSLFTKRKPIRKVKPEQLRLERVRPDQTIDYIMDHLRCETATILDARRLGKTNMLLLTFNTPSPPTRLVFDYEITRVYEYKPKIIACYNCHGLGHIAKYCPSEEVCKQCGRKHPENAECDEELFCVACQKQGHISLNSACPSRAPKDFQNLRHNAEVPQKTVSWSEKAQAGIPKQPVLLDEHEKQIKELKKENQQLRAVLQELLERLTPQQRDIPPQTPSREGEQPSPTAKAQRGRSKSRVGRSSSKKVTANSKTPPYTGAAPSQQISAYYRPLTSKDRNDSFEWLREVEAQAGSLPILVGGDFNAKLPTWGYTKADPRGRVFHDVIEMSTLNICNSLDTPTRIGLHAKQQDTTPDLTLASAGLVRQWEVKSTTWGSDHLPIIITLNRKKVREKREVLVFDWEKFRMATGDCFTDFEGFSAAVAEARPYAREYIPCNDTATHMDMHLANLWRKANRLTQQYRYKGKRHRDLMRLKRQYRLIKEYQEMLEADAWHDTCAKLDREPGLKRLWQILRSLLGKKKGAPPLSELFLREEPTSLEDRVIHTFFPHAAETPPLQLPYIRIADPRAELDTPFTLGRFSAEHGHP
ncbi:hypothetical protein HPB52_009586 [Rhipicephalus sanguineus]|uniref:CCHC-type domain-containing protein n=1 Tax=Rhipicephalus sanguineus TaxID=34632 RepID=A0A9D4Q5P5_RHISA|nr:hypothetical protein HPB52_009586 [Rhipicephalus sanguineus]